MEQNGNQRTDIDEGWQNPEGKDKALVRENGAHFITGEGTKEEPCALIPTCQNTRYKFGESPESLLPGRDPKHQKPNGELCSKTGGNRADMNMFAVRGKTDSNAYEKKNTKAPTAMHSLSLTGAK
ncbi:hypothetical protein AA0482_2557 [Acetobacter cibinongensis NRIC 0482]|nr:hypothetical protein AA0482_2557 [Acetobacter cibinongensis NRIC 0482]